MNRWHRILDSKPIPIFEHLAEEVSKLFAVDLQRWPLPLDDASPATQALNDGERPAPDSRLFRAAFLVSRLDVGREFEALDDCLRNERWLTEGLDAKDKPMLLFLSRFMTEQLLALGEATGGRVTRARMLDVLARTERHFFAARSLVS